MANTYQQLYIQTVFAVKFRNACIQQAWKKNLHAVVANLINETGCKTITCNGVEDHVHCLLALKASCSVSDLMQNVKAKSSKWVNENGLIRHRFEWQSGYGAFSYNQKEVPVVYKYIQRQEEHHRKKSFREEYLELLREFKVDYNENYIFRDPE